MIRGSRRTGAAALAAAGLGLGAAAGASTGADGAGPVRTEAATARAAAPGRAQAVAFASAAGTLGVATLGAPGTEHAVATGRGGVTGSARSTVTVGTRRARAAVTARGLSIFGDLVTARRVTRTATARTGQGTTYGGSVAGLTVAGRPADPAPGTYSAGAYGTVAGLPRAGGLVVTLTRARGPYPAGSSVVVGRLEVTAPRPATTPAGPAPDPGDTTTPTTTATTPTHTDRAPAPRHAATPPSPAGRKRSSHHPATHRRPTAPVPRHQAPEVHAGLTGKGYAFPVFSTRAATADNFGAARQIGAHQGDDIFAPFGTPVVAVHDGRIGQVGTLPISGNRLWLHTESGAAFFYCHLSAFAPAAVNGAQVKAGTVLGFVGNTGDAEPTPPHLHFEVHPDGREDSGAVDPFPILTAWQENQDVPKGSWLTDTAERPGTLVQVRDFLAEG